MSLFKGHKVNRFVHRLYYTTCFSHKLWRATEKCHWRCKHAALLALISVVDWVKNPARTDNKVVCESGNNTLHNTSSLDVFQNFQKLKTKWRETSRLNKNTDGLSPAADGLCWRMVTLAILLILLPPQPWSEKRKGRWSILKMSQTSWTWRWF